VGLKREALMCPERERLSPPPNCAEPTTTTFPFYSSQAGSCVGRRRQGACSGGGEGTRWRGGRRCVGEEAGGCTLGADER